MRGYRRHRRQKVTDGDYRQRRCNPSAPNLLTMNVVDRVHYGLGTANFASHRVALRPNDRHVGAGRPHDRYQH